MGDLHVIYPEPSPSSQASAGFLAYIDRSLAELLQAGTLIRHQPHRVRARVLSRAREALTNGPPLVKATAPSRRVPGAIALLLVGVAAGALAAAYLPQ